MADKQVNEHAYFYNSQSDRYYNADGLSDYMSPFFKEGVFNGSLQVTANNDMTVTVAVGYAWVGITGASVKRLKHFTAVQTFPVETASGTLNRIDTVVIRRNDTDRDITMQIVKGSLSTEPTATAPTRSGSIYDLVIADISIPAGTVKITQDMITDKRADASVCGWVVSNVDEIDFSEITAQFDQFFSNYEGKVKDRYNAFCDYIALLQQQGDQSLADLKSHFSAYETQAETDFNTWFDKMKGQLSTDAAGNLQNEVDSSAELEFNRYYGLMTGTSTITKGSDGSTNKIVTNDDAVTATTTFLQNSATVKTITTVIVPVSGTYQYTKKSVITKQTGKTIVSTTYEKTAKA